MLRSRPDQEAGEVYRRIRQGDDADGILRHVKHGDMLVQLSLVPESRFRYEFPYLPDMPPFLRQRSNPYLDSEVYEYLLRGSPEPSHPPAHAPRLLPGPQDAAAAGTGLLSGASQRDPYVKPYLSATVAHPWLDSVRPSKWTAVSSDDNLMRKLLHDYILFEYDWFTFFRLDYFLEDMATLKQRFCSSLLTNTLLCMGCVSHLTVLPYLPGSPSLTCPVLPPRSPEPRRVLESEKPRVPISRRGQKAPGARVGSRETPQRSC